MVIIATILIAAGALIGILMAIQAFEGHHIPKGLAMLHGTAVLIGIVLIFIYALTTDQQHKHWDSLIIFLIAATVGVYILHKDITHQRFPLWIIIVHGLIGLGGLIWITVHLLN